MSTSDFGNGLHRSRKLEVALGVTMLGLVFSSVLYGITLSQLYTYYRRFPRDPKSIKALVVFIAIFDAASVVLVCHACWYYLVTNGTSSRSVWSLNVEYLISMFISAIAEGFMIYRVWLLSCHRHLLTIFLLSFALLHFVSGQVSAAEFLKLEKFAKFGSSKIPSVLRLSSAAVCDTGIAISLCYFLQQKRTGYKRTDEIIDHLMLFSINSGLLTSLTSIACLITYLVVPKTWVYIALCFLISRLYANTFLNALNSRHILQSDDNDMDTPVLPKFHSTEVVAGGRGRLYGGLSVKTPTQIDVLVVTETVTQSDLSRVSSSQSDSKNEMKRKDTGSDSSSYSIQEVPRARLSYGSQPARATITQ